MIAVNRHKGTPEYVWEIDNKEGYGDVLSLGTYDITGSGDEDLLVGRADGMVQVFSFDESMQPFEKFNYSLTESVTSIHGGIVCTPGYKEVLVSTYTGWILGLSTEMHQKQVSSVGDQVRESIVDDVDEKIAQLGLEIDELQKKVSVERDNYQNSAHSTSAVSAVPHFAINDRFQLSQEDASYTLSIEVQMPMDTILLQSNVPIDLLDVAKNSAVVSYSACDPETGNYLLATYRCQANTTR
jgi:Bardet-Biedl syndrome 7 protein